MKKSKHFRKDVIMARIIAAVILIILIVLISFTVSLFTKPSGSDKNSQNTENTEGLSPGNQNNVNDDTQNIDKDSEEPNIDTESEADEKVYVKATTQVRLRAEANTNCATLDRIDAGTKLEVLEELEGWYKVIHNGQEGYVSANYVEVVEE